MIKRILVVIILGLLCSCTIPSGQYENNERLGNTKKKVESSDWSVKNITERGFSLETAYSTPTISLFHDVTLKQIQKAKERFIYLSKFEANKMNKEILDVTDEDMYIWTLEFPMEGYTVIRINGKVMYQNSSAAISAGGIIGSIEILTEEEK